MELLSDTELEAMVHAGSAIEVTPAWDVIKRELERRRAAIVQAAMLGRLETYEDYLEKRAEYSALTQMINMPAQLRSMGADNAAES